MTLNGWLQILIFFLIILAVTKPLGVFMTHVFNREKTFLDPVLRPVERLIYKLTGVDETREMRWTEYAVAMLLFSAVSMLALYLIQRLQGYLPFIPSISPVSIRAPALRRASSLRPSLRPPRLPPTPIGKVMFPFCVVGALLLVSQGVVQNLRPYDAALLLEKQTVEVDKKDANGNVVTNADGTTAKETQTVNKQIIAQGPVASQEAIKMWGTNGGGFFNANSAYPFENPTPFSNLLEMFAIFAVSAGLTYTLGRMTGSQKHGWAVFAGMAVLFSAGLIVSYWSEARGNPLLADTNQEAKATQEG